MNKFPSYFSSLFIVTLLAVILMIVIWAIGYVARVFKTYPDYSEVIEKTAFIVIILFTLCYWLVYWGFWWGTNP